MEKNPHYDNIFGNLGNPVLQAIRKETFGTDFGQNSWITEEEFSRFLDMLELHRDCDVLDVASGAGGPARFLARKFGCHVTGVDINEKAVEVANLSAKSEQLDSIAKFQIADVSESLPFDNDQFDSVICIDAMTHLPNRRKTVSEFYRVLKPDGRMLFTDPAILTGLVSSEELAGRSSIGLLIFSPPGQNEILIRGTGFELLHALDTTDSIAQITKRRLDAREKYRRQLIEIEGEELFEMEQKYYFFTNKLSMERRLSRFVFVAKKPNLRNQV